MNKPSPLVCFAAVALTAAVMACGSNSDTSEFDNGSRDAGTGRSGITGDATIGGGDGDGGVTIGGGGSGDFDPTTFIVTPATATIDVTVPGTPGTQQLTATDSGKPINASFRILDRGELGTVGLTSGLFTAAGTFGGVVSVVADYQNATSAPSLLTINLHATQNGASATDGGTGTGGAGGNGGVGGDGSGGPVTDAIKAVLDGANPGSDSAAWLYPYDATVFPRAILPPLLQWQPGTSKDYDGIKIHLVAPNYDYTGYFAKPAGATVFQNHPIDPAAWQALYSSYTDPTAGQSVTVSVTLSSGGKAYALPDHTWTIAGGSLEGTVYYNSYNTHLVTNSDFYVNVGGNRVRIGAATLAIRADSTGPVVAAGLSSGNVNGSECANGDANGGAGCDATGCRVCHSVAAKGGSLITQQGATQAGSTNYAQSKIVGLSPVVPEKNFGNGSSEIFTFPAISPDGSLVFSGYGLAAGLYKSTDASNSNATILPSNLVTNMPTFSPDGAHVAFNWWGGTGSDSVSLAQIDYNAGANSFTAPKTLYTPVKGSAVAWPTYLPSSSALVFSVQSNNIANDALGETWNGTNSQLWWYDVASNMAAPLANLNGTNLPTSSTHKADSSLNFEPTVNPVTSGGYAWVVFTSRRLYGNVATLDPEDSDPRHFNADSLTSPTPKKLWVAAIDLGAAPGTDPSHPAFYLPAQELLAGNSRGYWVVDPCKADGSSCATGDQCCGGYCQQNGGDSGALTCGSTKPMCANEQEKCTTTSDCCNAASGIECLNNVCSISIPR